MWTLNGSEWAQLGPAPGATAIGRGASSVVIATGAGNEVEVRKLAQLGEGGAVSTLRWSVAVPSAPIVSVDQWPTGALAMVAADDQGVAYFASDREGAMVPLSPAPVQPFTPLVRWLDSTRLLVLSTDDLQVSRLAVIDTEAHTMAVAPALGGLRAVTASDDGRIVAAATETSVYVGPLAAFQGATPPERIAAVGDSTVVWALALDGTGSRLFLLSGTVAPDGHVTSIHELGFAMRGSTWTKVLDLPAPFSEAIGQLCLT